VAGIRPLADGTLLVADGLEGRLFRVSGDLARAEPVGREGAGPREYRTPDALYAMAGDTTLMVDLGNGRLAVLDPEGQIVRTIPMVSGDGPRMRLMVPGAVDRNGRVFFRGMGMMRGGVPDSASVQVFDPRSEEADEVAQVKLPEMNTQSSGGANNQQTMISPIPLSREDAWTASPDGDLVVARSGDRAYWLEIVGQDGAVRGPEVAYTPIPVRDADKDEWIAARSNALGVGMEIENGRSRTTFSRGGRGGEADPSDYEWPETKPAFPGASIQVASDGTVWLRRHVSAGEPPKYDILDDGGRLLGSVRLPEGRTLEGFGDGHVYLSTTDDLDFVWLERYELPVL
jgi:sugar lactone lactonase YvrE